MKLLAQHRSACALCPTPIMEGDPIQRNPMTGDWAHDICPPDPQKVHGQECSVCGLVHPGEC